jgi:arsenate reductase
MAEGLLRALGGDRFDACSAETEVALVRPLAIRAMAEIDIDIAGQESKTLGRYLGEPFDAVIGAQQRLHWSFPDPSQASGMEDEQLAVYRRVRDAIRARIAQELLP